MGEKKRDFFFFFCYGRLFVETLGWDSSRCWVVGEKGAPDHWMAAILRYLFQFNGKGKSTETWRLQSVVAVDL